MSAGRIFVRAPSDITGDSKQLTWPKKSGHHRIVLLPIFTVAQGILGTTTRKKDHPTAVFEASPEALKRDDERRLQNSVLIIRNSAIVVRSRLANAEII